MTLRVSEPCMAFTLRLLLCLLLCPLLLSTAQAQQSSDQAAIEADQLEFDETEDMLKASGNVKIFYQGNTLRADSVEWKQKADILKAVGNVVLIDEDGTVSTIDEAVISDKMREAVMQRLRILLADKSRLTGADAKRTGGTLTVLNKARYTACKPCKDNPEERPTWQLKTARTINDEDSQTIYHEDLRLELLGVPVLYLPYMSHPGPKVKKRSGFLTPSFGVSSDMGTDISVPYFFDLAPHYDLTVTPRITSKAGNMLKLGFRHLTQQGIYSVDMNGLWVSRKDNKDNDRSFRGNISAKGEFDLRENWTYGFQLERQTDETFLRRYNLSDQNYLESFAYLQNLEDKTYFDARVKEYDTTLASVNADTLPALLPTLTYDHIFDQAFMGGVFSLKANVMGLTRDVGTDMSRAVVSGRWERGFTSQGGHLLSTFAEIRADAYQAKKHFNPETNEPYDDNVQTRGIGYVGAKWSYPLVRLDDKLTQTIEPIAQLIVSPNKKNDPSIPNEDSLSIDFDNTNLFEISRYAGLDLVESGSRADFGLRYSARFESGQHASVFVGQSLRRRKNELVGRSTGLEDRESDYVVEFNAAPTDKINLSSRMRVDKEDLEIVRSETDLTAQYGPARLNMGYVFLDRRISDDNKEREEARASFGYNLSGNWRFDASIRQDMVRETSLNRGIGISYRDDCTYIRIGFTQDYVRDRNIGPSNNFSILINLKTLGGVATSSKEFQVND
ncbi:MAG: LPS-assembly protein LptD [Parvibaculales bacterium]